MKSRSQKTEAKTKPSKGAVRLQSSLNAHRQAIGQLLRVEKARARVTHKEISDQLKRAGILQTPTNLATKFSRGTMEAALLLALLDVFGVHTLKVDDLIQNLPSKGK